MTLHTYTPNQCPYYQLTAAYSLRYSLDKFFLAAHQNTMGENNTETAVKGCGVKTNIIRFLFTG